MHDTLSTATIPVVLVIDGNFESRATLRRELLDISCLVVTASSGEEAISLAKRSKPDLIVIDRLTLDTVDSNALRTLQSSRVLEHTPIALTNAPEVDNLLDNLKDEIDTIGYLPRPMCRRELVAIVGNAVR